MELFSTGVAFEQFGLSEDREHHALGALELGGKGGEDTLAQGFVGSTSEA